MNLRLYSAVTSPHEFDRSSSRRGDDIIGD